MNETEFSQLLSEYGRLRHDQGEVGSDDPTYLNLSQKAHASARTLVDVWRELRRENTNLLRKLQIANEATQFCHDHHWTSPVGSHEPRKPDPESGPEPVL